MTYWEKRFNKLIGKTRFKVERTFGGINRWFSGGTARYRGIEKMHTQNIMEALCYNLYRSLGIIRLTQKIKGNRHKKINLYLQKSKLLSKNEVKLEKFNWNLNQTKNL